MRISGYIPAALALIAAGLLAMLAAVLAVNQIEKSSKFAIDQVLLADGNDWTDVTVDGLLVTLTGTAEDEAGRFRALRLASSVVDSTRVIDQLGVAAAAEIAAPRFSIEILRNDAGVSLIGLVPAEVDRAELVRSIVSMTNDGAVTDLLEAADFPTPRGWNTVLEFSLEALAKLPRSKISVAVDRVEITAISDSGDEKLSLEQELYAAAPGSIDLRLNISAPRPVITPFTLRFLIDENGGVFDACSAHTADGRARILASAAAAGLQGEATCTLGLGVPSPRWADAVTAGIQALSQLGGGALTFSDADVTLIAQETTDQGVFDRVVGELEAALPEVFSLEAIKPEPVVIRGTGAADDDGPPELLATLSPEGLLQLRGRITDQRLRLAVEGFARAGFPTAEIDPAMVLDPDLPDGWAGRVFAGLESLSLLSHGALVVQPKFLDLRGNTGDPSAKAEISRILSAGLGEGANFALNVTYVEQLDPQLNLPTGADCVSDIGAIIAAQKVSFEPGSAEISAASLSTIDRIAEVMEQCSNFPMEIAGHTDSQGREVMNQSLSQRRAEAVLIALQARRVLTGNLLPKGYGEANPIADNGTEEGREANRRIEFTLIPEPEEEDDDAGEGGVASDTSSSNENTGAKPDEQN